MDKIKLILSLICLLVVPASVFSQSKIDSTITIKNGNFFIDGKIYSKNQIVEILKTDPQSNILVSKSQQKGIGYFTLTVGAILTVRQIYFYSLASKHNIEVKESDHLITLVALGLDILGANFFYESNKNFKNAIKVYNIKKLSDNFDVNFQVGISNIGIAINF